MRSVAPWTYPSVISLFSGLYPQQHGADGDAAGRLSTFSAELPLLPRLLRDAGYHTAGFVTNPFLHEWNPLHRAFDHYDPSFVNNKGPVRGLGELAWTERMYADSVNPAVRAWFDARPYTQPEFTYVHYIDVHGRREGPERYQDAPFEKSYEGAVRYVDQKIHELYDYFSARYGGELLFLVTSDHGQDLADDITVGDGPPLRQRKASLHDFNLLIPFYVLPGRSVPVRAVQGACTNADVVPTLLEWLGLPPLEGAPGRSLVAAIRGESYDGDSRVLYARNSAFGRLEEATVHEARKFMRYREPPAGPVRARRLFDLRADPREIHPLSEAALNEEAELEAVAAPGALVYPAVFEEPDPALQEQLDALGYGGEDEPELPDDETPDGKR
jgi:arylsulfatase A-like enzyme